MFVLNCELNGRNVYSICCNVGLFLLSLLDSCCCYVFMGSNQTLETCHLFQQGHFFVGTKQKILKTSISLPLSNLKNSGPQPVSEPSSLATSSLADLQGIHRQLPLHEEEKSYSQWKLLPINQSGQHQNIHENVIPLLTTRKKSIAI